MTEGNGNCGEAAGATRRRSGWTWRGLRFCIKCNEKPLEGSEKGDRMRQVSERSLWWLCGEELRVGRGHSWKQ